MRLFGWYALRLSFWLFAGYGITAAFEQVTGLKELNGFVLNFLFLVIIWIYITLVQKAVTITENHMRSLDRF